MNLNSRCRSSERDIAEKQQKQMLILSLAETNPLQQNAPQMRFSEFKTDGLIKQQNPALYSPCAAHDLWAVKRKGVALVGL